MTWTIILILLLWLGILVAIIGKIYQILSTGWCRSQTCLIGKTVIITGANTGIGYETALDLAKRGARVILACRDAEKANKARKQIIEDTGNTNIIVKMLNLSSFQSVRAFAKDIVENEEQLNILINNAGTVMAPRKNTEDGNLIVVQANYLGHFLLTHLLGELLKKTPGSRIVNVSSLLAGAARLDVNNINKIYDHWTLYCNTKACNIFFTRELARRLEGTSVTTYSLHPGSVKTDIWIKVVSVYKAIYDCILSFYSKTSLEGAQTTIYLAVTKGIEKYNGAHFSDCKKIAHYKTTSDMNVAKKLWKVSEDLVELKPEEKQF